MKKMKTQKCLGKLMLFAALIFCSFGAVAQDNANQVKPSEIRNETPKPVSLSGENVTHITPRIYSSRTLVPNKEKASDRSSIMLNAAVSRPDGPQPTNVEGVNRGEEIAVSETLIKQRQIIFSENKTELDNMKLTNLAQYNSFLAQLNTMAALQADLLVAKENNPAAVSTLQAKLNQLKTSFNLK